MNKIYWDVCLREVRSTRAPDPHNKIKHESLCGFTAAVIRDLTLNAFDFPSEHIRTERSRTGPAQFPGHLAQDVNEGKKSSCQNMWWRFIRYWAVISKMSLLWLDVSLNHFTLQHSWYTVITSVCNLDWLLYWLSHLKWLHEQFKIITFCNYRYTWLFLMLL